MRMSARARKYVRTCLYARVRTEIFWKICYVAIPDHTATGHSLELTRLPGSAELRQTSLLCIPPEPRACALGACPRDTHAGLGAAGQVRALADSVELSGRVQNFFGMKRRSRGAEVLSSGHTLQGLLIAPVRPHRTHIPPPDCAALFFCLP